MFQTQIHSRAGNYFDSGFYAQRFFNFQVFTRAFFKNRFREAQNSDNGHPETKLAFVIKL